MDEGPILGQAAVPVLPGDTEATLGERVLAAEHLLYPRILELFAAGLITVNGNKSSTASDVNGTWVRFSPQV
jgi:phosphoribosylglycinamide formyltransferase-1